MSSAAAASPALVTHGLTLKGASLSWAIAHRRKTIENRSTRLPTGWIALHTGVGKLPAARAVELAANCPGMPTEESLPHGCIIGAMRIDRACDVAGCAGTPSEPWALGPVCNVIGAVCLLPKPLAHKGFLGVWKIDEEICKSVRAGLSKAPVLMNDPERLPPKAVSRSIGAAGKRKATALLAPPAAATRDDAGTSSGATKTNASSGCAGAAGAEGSYIKVPRRR